MTSINVKWYLVFTPEAAATESARTRPKPLLIQIGTLKICLAFSGGQWRAVADACPHLGESLSKGTLNPFGEVICPWHSYRYHLATGAECRQRSGAAQTFTTRLTPEGLFVGVPVSESGTL